MPRSSVLSLWTLGALLSFAARAAAYDLFDLQYQWWAGAGPHAAVIVVDFWPDNGAADSFAFGVRFELPEINARAALDALQAADAGFRYAATPEGFLTDIWYTHNDVTHHASYDWPASY